MIAILAILAGLLLPSLARARSAGKRAVCIGNLHQVGLAIHLYAQDHSGSMPYGPAAPPFSHPSELYPSTGSPTSLLSLRDGRPVGLGLLLAKSLSQTPAVLFCPASDQPIDARGELAKVGTNQAQCSYYYRHAGVTGMFQNPPETPPSVRLDSPGNNSRASPSGRWSRILSLSVRTISPSSMYDRGPTMSRSPAPSFGSMVTRPI